LCSPTYFFSLCVLCASVVLLFIYWDNFLFSLFS
jgi:hypothetical protein